jgi:hypothetical protein
MQIILTKRDITSYFMLNNDTDMQEKEEEPCQWALIVGQVVEKVESGTNMSTTIEFDNLEVDLPNVKGPGGRYLGGANWKLNDKVIWTTEGPKDLDKHLLVHVTNY